MPLVCLMGAQNAEGIADEKGSSVRSLRQIRVVGFSGDRKRRPYELTDSDVVDAILDRS
jgi:hypothetical protein